jgi:outer membrane usher protein
MAVAVLSLLIAARPCDAAASAAGAGQQRALLDLVVNDVPRGEAYVLVRGTEIWIDVAALRDAGVRISGGDRDEADGREVVRLGSLGTLVRAELDERALAVRLRVDPALLGHQDVQLRSVRPDGIEYRRDPSGFVNYGVNWTSGGERLVGLESGLSLGPGLFTTYFTSSRVLGNLRGPTSVTFDRRERLQRWTVGDAIAASGTLGAALPMAGVTISRDYDLDPYFIRFPTVGLGGALTTPAAVDVYVNDRLIRTEQLLPGTFTISDLPIPAGAGGARLVVRDAFGRQQEIGGSYYVTTALLQRGLQQYQYSFGVQRLHPTTSSWDYGHPALLATHRVGVTDGLTLGGRIEASDDVVSGGPQAVMRLGRLGELEAAAAMSRGPRGSGTAGSAAYQYVGRATSVTGAVRAATRPYETLATALDLRGALALDAGVSASARLGPRATATLAWQQQRSYGTTPDHSSVSASGSMRLTARSDMSITVSRSRIGGAPSLGIFAGFSVAVSERASAGASIQHAEGRTAVAAEMQRSLPLGEGYGYRMRAEGGPSSLVDGEVQYQTRFGRYEMRQEHLEGRAVTTLNASGSVVGIGGRLFASRPVEQSFALVRVPGVSHVRAFMSNQEIGQTDGRGNLLIPNLLPYYGNRLSIADVDVPLDLSIGAKEMTLAPPYRGGAVALFPVSREHRLTGSVVVARPGGVFVPVSGRLQVQLDGRTIESPIGHGGQFYLEGLSPGSYHATVEHETVTCRFTLRVPEAEAPIVKLGTVQCLAP